MIRERIRNIIIKVADRIRPSEDKPLFDPQIRKGFIIPLSPRVVNMDDDAPFSFSGEPLVLDSDCFFYIETSGAVHELPFRAGQRIWISGRRIDCFDRDLVSCDPS